MGVPGLDRAGPGFVLSPEEAAALIDRDPHNRNALFPYFNGQDLNSRPDIIAQSLGDQLPRLANRHFPAMEQPDLLIGDIRAFFASLR